MLLGLTPWARGRRVSSWPKSGRLRPAQSRRVEDHLDRAGRGYGLHLRGRSGVYLGADRKGLPSGRARTVDNGLARAARGRFLRPRQVWARVRKTADPCSPLPGRARQAGGYCQAQVFPVEKGYRSRARACRVAGRRRLLQLWVRAAKPREFFSHRVIATGWPRPGRGKVIAPDSQLQFSMAPRRSWKSPSLSAALR